VNADVEHWDFGEDRWDLICLLYMGGAKNVDVLHRALRRGGVLVVEYAPGEQEKKGALASSFTQGWKVLRSEEVEARPDFGVAVAHVVRLVVEKE
jgi:hypothetical protein